MNGETGDNKCYGTVILLPVVLSGKLQSLTNKQYQVNNSLLLPFCTQVTVKLQGIVKGCDERGSGQWIIL